MPGAALPTSQACSLLHTHRKLNGAHLKEWPLTGGRLLPETQPEEDQEGL